MTKIEIALSSKTTWLIILAVVAAALNALVPYLSGTWLTVAQDLLMVFAVFTAPAEIQKAGRIGAREGHF